MSLAGGQHKLGFFKECLLGLSISENSSTSSVVLIHLAAALKVEQVPRYQLASFLVGSLLTFPTALRAFRAFPILPLHIVSQVLLQAD